MNYKMIFNTLGKVFKIEAGLLAFPIIVSLCYSEWSVATFIFISLLISLALGFLLTILFKFENKPMYAKEGFIIVAFAWIAISIITALPFYLSKEIPSFLDALFESVSGLTTTGASILAHPENLSYGLKFLRSFTHFIGGMGVLVFVMAIVPKTADRNIHILRAEMPGPIVDKVHPRSKSTAKILYFMYIGLTALLVILLMLGGMNLFESLIHAFGTAGTGGFGIRVDSVASYSPYIQWVLSIFMLLYGINFNVYFLILVGKFKNAIKSKEIINYGLIFLIATIIVALNIYTICGNIGTTIRHSVFQVSSLLTTTGFSTLDISSWNSMAKFTLFGLMFIGGCAGSTAGGLKVFRISILFKRIRFELKRLIHPNTIEVMTFDGKKLDDETVNGITSYFSLYAMLIIFFTLLVSIDGLSFEANLSAVVSCVNNIGPAFMEASANYTCFSPFSKVVLMFAMLLGRLEIYPLILALSPITWFKK